MPLSSLPRLPLSILPTPVQHLGALGDELGHTDLWVKRDDLTSPLYGGNKVRKLEYLLADAKHRGCREVLTVGGIGTNHGLATAVFSRELGLGCELVLLEQPVTDHVRHNLRLYHHFGARLHYVRSMVEAAAYMTYRMVSSRFGLTSRKAAVIGPGGSNPLGSLGFVNAALELQEQVERGELPEPETIFVALGSSGTLAGLALGLRLIGLRSRLVGVRVTPRWGTNERTVARLANRSLALLRKSGVGASIAPLKPSDIRVEHRFFEPGYGFPTAAGNEAIRLATAHGLKLEPTYTGKAFAALIEHLRSGRATGPVLYWHTLSSADLSAQAESVDWRDLPPEFHRFFPGT